MRGTLPAAWSDHPGRNVRQRLRLAIGEPLANLYRAEGLNMLPGHATHATGGYSTEASILEMLSRMRTGRFKVAAHLAEWFDEFRAYPRKDGLIVKVNDDIMSATRVAVMDHRSAKPVEFGARPRRNAPTFAIGSDVREFGRLHWGY